MIMEIISGGQTGANRAALDVAIELGIPHGGWVPKGRMTDLGRLPDQYVMQETTSISDPAWTKMNVADSDGTLIVSHGELTGGSAFTRDVAAKHRKPCLHIDLDSLTESVATEIVSNWVDGRHIEILNVAGPCATEDSKIYDATKSLLRKVIRSLLPKTVDEAVDILLYRMPLRDKARTANSEEADLSGLYKSLGSYIRNRFLVRSGNPALLESCAQATGRESIREYEASLVIIKKLWRRLRNVRALRAAD